MGTETEMVLTVLVRLFLKVFTVSLMLVKGVTLANFQICFFPFLRRKTPVTLANFPKLLAREFMHSNVVTLAKF